MRKEYYSNIDYNRKKRRTAVTMAVLLMILMFGMSAVFVALEDYTFSSIFAIIGIVPVMTFPQAFKIYPVKNDAQVVITERDITVSGKTVKLKEIAEIKVYIDLPSSILDSENQKTLEAMRSVKPENVYFGNLDVIYNLPGDKKGTLFSHIEGVVDALETLVVLGVRNYTLTYNVKKKSLVSEYDFYGEILQKRQEVNKNLSKKQKNKQLL